MNREKLNELVETSPVTSWANGESRVQHYPWLVYISITNFCNHKCTFCSHPVAMRDDKGNMTMETFTRIVDQLPPTVKKIYLQKQGEPFINKRIEQMVEYLRKKLPKVHIAFHTNGVLAKGERVKKVMNYIDSMGVSIDSIDRKLYHKIHLKDDFDILMENMKTISDYRLSMPENKRPHVFIDYIHQKANAHEGEDRVLEFFKSRFPGIPSVDFHWLNNYQGVVEEGNLDVYNKLPHDSFPRCVFPWSSIAFLWDGKVTYCFVEPKEDVFFGDIHKNTFDEIWNCDQYVEFRKMMTERRFGDIQSKNMGCATCSWLWQPKVQSPRNLEGGYGRIHKSRVIAKNFGDLMDMPEEQIYELAAEYYMSGEIGHAVGALHLISASSDNESLKEDAESLLEKCHNVLKQYKNLSLLKKTINEEGINEENFTNYYYDETNPENAALTKSIRNTDTIIRPSRKPESFTV